MSTQEIPAAPQDTARKTAVHFIGEATLIDPDFTLVPGLKWRENAVKGKADMFYSVSGRVPFNGTLLPVTVNVPAVNENGEVVQLGVESGEGAPTMVSDFQPESALKFHKEGDQVVFDEHIVTEGGAEFNPAFGVKHLVFRNGKTLKLGGLRITEPHFVKAHDGGQKRVAEGWAASYEVVRERATASGPVAALTLNAGVRQAARATKAAVPAAEPIRL